MIGYRSSALAGRRMSSRAATRAGHTTVKPDTAGHADVEQGVVDVVGRDDEDHMIELEPATRCTIFSQIVERSSPAPRDESELVPQPVAD